MRRVGNTVCNTRKRRESHGFSLVELVIVLVIVAILAAVVSTGVAGYIKRTRYDKNEQNAITVYQTAQTAMSQMTSAGTMDSWIRDLINDSTINHINALESLENPETNDSVGRTVYLTYNPGVPNSESEKLRDLLSAYIYDQTIFSGTISVEFYMSMTYDANKIPYYSARVISAFFSFENKATEGWDSTRLNGSTDGLPDRDTENRYKITLVGYFNGSDETVTPKANSVFLPHTQSYVLETHIVGPTEDPDAEAYGYLFNLRNGETLDVSWALFDEDGKLHSDHKENLTVKLVTDSEFGNSGNYDDVVLTIKAADIQAVNFVSDGTKVFESVGSNGIERVSESGLITIDVKIGSGDTQRLKFPITRTVVSHDGRTGCPKDPAIGDGTSPADYYEYRLSIDCMMVRSDESVEESNRYNIKRLFGDTPRNIYASLEGYFDYYEKDGTTVSSRSIPTTYAARAIDDPVFLVDVKTVNGNTSYVYKINYKLSAFDGKDDVDPETQESLTGRCYVNTLFGDYKYSDSLAGTNWTSEGGDAVITEFRHLYNIRNVDSSYVSNFKIVRDLDWYVDEPGLRYVTDVRMFTYNASTLKYSAPASNSTKVNAFYTVPFPAFNTLYATQTLEAMTDKNGTVYSINNLQLRKSSFDIEGDLGYGLICTNLGSIGNLRTNNFSLVMADVDGKKNDVNSIYTSSISVNTQVGGSGNLPKNNFKPIGGLVGINSSTGNVGNESSTIVMSNSIVMANNYWNIYADANKTATGGIIGLNENSVSGSIEINGSFAVVGRDCVGGIIGKSTNDIGAKLLVNSSKAPEGRYTLPSYSSGKFSTQNLSCIIICKNNGGGAIGLLEGSELSYEVRNPFTYSQNPENGVFSGIRDNFQIDVNLPDNSLIVDIGGYNAPDVADYSSAGGAIGYMKSCGGDTASIRVNNSGSIIVHDKSSHIYCGGAIGREYNCSTEYIYIDVNNGSGRLGYIDNSSGPVASGGAIGQINSTADGRTIVINVVNNGTITARGDNNGQGAGGAVGGAESGTKIKFVINVENANGSNIIGVGKNQSTGNGVGGAIGGMGNSGADDSSQFPSGTVIYSENHGSISGEYHVGGAVGNAPLNKGEIYAVNSGNITGNNNFVGGAVGRISYSHFGIIQATLESNSEIKGGRFVGGAVGRLAKFQDGATVRTIVEDSSDVIGTYSIVGGICGDLRFAESGLGNIELRGDSSNPLLTVKGNDGVGGAIGIMRSESDNYAKVIMPKQTSTNKMTLNIEGANYVGGAVGGIRSTNNAFDEMDPSTLLSKNFLIKNIYVDISVTLNSRSYVSGTGENVGGAVGYISGSFDDNNGNYASFGGTINVSAVSGSASEGFSYIKGKKFVGGAVGHFSSIAPAGEGEISVNFASAPWKIMSNAEAGTEANVGGAVGYFQGSIKKQFGKNDNKYKITANLGSSSITSNGYNVGGAIGKNQVRNGIINVNNFSGYVSGQYNVGGAIGLNEYQFNEVYVTVTSAGTIEAVGTCSVEYKNNRAPDGSKGDGSNVGGAVGSYNFTGNDTVAISSIINAKISGNITGVGNNVGGAVGYCNSSKNRHLIRNVIATLQGDATVHGANNVGGALGFSLSNITNVKSDISGTSSIEGGYLVDGRIVEGYRVGGAIGWAYAIEGQTGQNNLSQNPENLNPDDLSISDLETKLNNGLYKASGRIANVSATISADFALQGVASIGGAVGQSGYKSNYGGNIYASPAIVDVQASINTGYLFDPFETGIGLDELNPIDKPKEKVEGAYGNACIGGVIGLVVDGRINSVSLTGTGGTVNTNSQYPCPTISMNNAVLLAAKGNSIGGIIGQIGLLGYGGNIGSSDGGAQNVTVSNISASDNLGICVVSMNGANKIGGWIGSGYGVYGGIGNRVYDDYKKESTRSVYNVNNVRCVYSEGSDIGGFCGYSRGYRKNTNVDTNNQPGLVTWADINVNLKGATIIGNTAVGGAFGCIEGVKFACGCININMKEHSVIGDSSGSHICEEAGGAIGYLRNETESFGIPVTVTIDSSSNIWADKESSESSGVYGVGGVIGRCSGVFGKLKYNGKDFYNSVGTLTITSDNSNTVSVYSKSSNVGGVIGVMDKVDMSGYQFNATTNYYSFAKNVTVQADGNGICAGGFVGKINSISANMCNCYCYGTSVVHADGENAFAGGFAGDVKIASDRTINSCYTTAEVKSDSAAYTGGFIGRMIQGNVTNCYVGGHTFQGSYVAGEGNISGAGNVGGFVGATTGTNTVSFENCYSTASVLGVGIGDNVGGFIGSSTSSTTIKNSYCTGRVVGRNMNTVGSFAGTIGNADLSIFTNNQVMRNINPGDFALIGSYENNSIGEGYVKYDYDTEIGTGSDTGHPFDSLLNDKTFNLRAVIGTEHYGDWPIAPEGTSIDEATIQIYVKTGETELGEPEYDWENFVNDKYEYEFNGTSVVIDENLLKVIVQGQEISRDKYIIYYRDNNKAGTATVTFAAKSGSGYSGAISKTFKITKANVIGVNAVFNELSQEYSGADLKPDVTVTLNGTELVYGTDYEFAYDRLHDDLTEGFDNDHRSIGSMYVYVVGKGNYTGIKMIGQFEISCIDLSKSDPKKEIELIGAENLVYDEDAEGNPVEHKPGVVVRYNNTTLKGIMEDPDQEDYEYTRGYDYVYSYANNKLAGEDTALLVIKGTASLGTGTIYTGETTVTFTINPALNDWIEDPAIDGWIYGEYDETSNVPTGSLIFGEIEYAFYNDSNCTNLIDDISEADVGRYYVKVYAKPSSNYTGPVDEILPFNISPADITGRVSVTIDPRDSEYPYTGQPIDLDKNKITVTVNDAEGEPVFDLDPDDFEIASYNPSDHTEPGIVEFTIAGTGNYKGTATGTFTIYREYTVTFYSDGQECGTDTVRAGQTVSAPNIPIITGYRLDGWCTDPECTKPYIFTTPVTGDFPLYANWVKEWTVTFDTGDENIKIDPKPVDDGGYAERPEDPVRTGYRFDGWYNNPEFEGTPYEFDTKVYGNIDLHAKWTPVYTVTFNTGEGTLIESQLIPIEEGGCATEPLAPPEWDGYYFEGWYSDEDCVTPYNFSDPVIADITIYAKWVELPDSG